MGLQGPSDLVLAFARVLHVNGESTDDTLAAAERLSNRLDLRVRIIPRWGELHLAAEDEVATLVSVATADPTGVDMDRVVSAVRAIDQVAAGQLAPGAAMEAIRQISHARPAPLRCLCSSACGIWPQWRLSSPAPRPVRFCVAPWRATRRTPSCSRSARRCSLAWLGRWQSGIS